MDNKNYIVFKDVIYLDGDLWRQIKTELLKKEKGEAIEDISLTSYPLFERKRNGSLEPNGFISRKVSSVYFFDVTDANDKTKEEIVNKYNVEIHELPVPTRKVTQYMALLPVSADSYRKCNLTVEEIEMLGKEYMLVENRGDSYKITKYILTRRSVRLNQEIYLKIDFSKLTNELENKIINEVCHVVLNDNGYYDKIDVESDTKRYIIQGTKNGRETKN